MVIARNCRNLLGTGYRQLLLFCTATDINNCIYLKKIKYYDGKTINKFKNDIYLCNIYEYACSI